jgi:hypothetical protein
MFSFLGTVSFTIVRQEEKRKLSCLLLAPGVDYSWPCLSPKLPLCPCHSPLPRPAGLLRSSKVLPALCPGRSACLSPGQQGPHFSMASCFPPANPALLPVTGKWGRETCPSGQGQWPAVSFVPFTPTDRCKELVSIVILHPVFCKELTPSGNEIPSIQFWATPDVGLSEPPSMGRTNTTSQDAPVYPGLAGEYPGMSWQSKEMQAAGSVSQSLRANEVQR